MRFNKGHIFIFLGFLLAGGVVLLSLVYALTSSGISTGIIPGDTNGDGIHNIADSIYSLNHLFQGGPAPHSQSVLPASQSPSIDINKDNQIDILDVLDQINRNSDLNGKDSNDDGVINIIDVVDKINELFGLSAPSPIDCVDCGCECESVGTIEFRDPNVETQDPRRAYPDYYEVWASYDCTGDTKGEMVDESPKKVPGHFTLPNFDLHNSHRSLFIDTCTGNVIDGRGNSFEEAIRDGREACEALSQAWCSGEEAI
jgi:hypothetical protein